MDTATYTLEFEKPLRELQKQLDTLQTVSQESKVDVSKEISAIEKKIAATKADIYSNLTPWQRVQLSRHPKRPYSIDYIERIFTDFQELHGDRRFRDDAAIVGGPAFLDGKPVMVIGQQKGRNTKDNLKRNFGCPHPEGYRKAMRLMEMAERFKMPIVTLIDTPGAYPGIGAEERHVAEAIAVNIRDMSALTVPIISIVIGEGGSGGALGMAVADEVMILENGYYSVISPEGCAAILWKDRAAAPKAAEALKFSPTDLKGFGIVDEVVGEPVGGAHNDYAEAAATMKAAITSSLTRLKKKSTKQLLDDRYTRFRNLGVFEERAQAEAGAE
ncbi:acetyl-CoA carboxylase carboxyltransferase subunit alpha [Coraliomargarita akajimensis]|uniref:Acetyl-coenzyme A carboxylase carboxyl transferase subunit alpha n=1 Tax=Coraliomargarita akajimensis (strain DSM 45221 / IAM 15411 / JCM 23193 / KCTC 12865 / 04OKA010-24) TaxID=583355 RepID=D5EJ62_CORAD|nr:acetyl-CoA carboxylase carboxyltransferase subunit alpha [Coraliomargarita akajimensis]ADE54461.1 acetyl-CoA carboxylase, carboxyl transferase, alpha subunit [Coraliomargarita akajimensis DSM 45221]